MKIGSPSARPLPAAAALAVLLLGVSCSPPGASGRGTGLCVLVDKQDFKVRQAAVMVSSGNPRADAQRRSGVIGMRVPTPVGASSDFWAGLTVGGPKTDALERPPDCSQLNMRLCGALSCQQPGPPAPAIRAAPAGA